MMLQGSGVWRSYEFIELWVRDHVFIYKSSDYSKEFVLRKKKK